MAHVNISDHVNENSDVYYQLSKIYFSVTNDCDKNNNKSVSQ
jgi:hypothetical protein